MSKKIKIRWNHVRDTLAYVEGIDRGWLSGWDGERQADGKGIETAKVFVRGRLQGFVNGLMTAGITFEDAIAALSTIAEEKNLEDLTESLLPECWREEFRK